MAGQRFGFRVQGCGFKGLGIYITQSHYGISRDLVNKQEHILCLLRKPWMRQQDASGH